MAHFTNEAERLRAREACASACAAVAALYPVSVFPEDGDSVDCRSASVARITAQNCLDRWDRLYPPQGDAPLLPPQNPTGQREDTATVRLPVPYGPVCVKCGGLTACWCPLPQEEMPIPPRLSREEAEKMVEGYDTKWAKLYDDDQTYTERERTRGDFYAARAALLAALTGEVPNA